MPFPYVEASKIERELPYGHQGSGMGETEWTEFIQDKAKQESARVEEWVNDSYRGDNDSVPFVVQAAVIRLVRSVVTQVDSDGLNSEDVGDHSEDYRPPADVRDEVRNELGEAGYGDENVVKIDGMGR